ncbi:hypothetical protein CIRG_05424 [Coccidioides immitis RMSCC 2394]|uniref:HNH nuclease domain-containing protein n=1 Tax=Coccidioides immitis RMSCC 2394 TaxID=404692 RepID=A0A0J6YFL9_COCIT|nr:hypothetical protein CIRG_05424 [Coccidioides immitis RMSCC 2394]
MSAHHEHRASLEQFLDFSPLPPSLNTDEVARARGVFKKLISHCEPVQRSKPYKRVTLARSTYEHVQSQDIFLHQFFVFLDAQEHPSEPDFERGISRFSGFDPAASVSEKIEAEKAVNSFAEYLFNNFFLPLKASGNKTSQPTPAALTSSVENVVGTLGRLSVLRRDCLIRDHHRCVVTRMFDIREAERRFDKDGTNAEDDDGSTLIYAPGQFEYLEVAHIIPHSIMSSMSTGSSAELNQSKKNALAILRMFDPSAIHLIEGSDIDHSTNAISLTLGLHQFFGDFKFYFEEMDPTTYPQHTYRIDSKKTNPFARPEGLPVTRTLFLSPHHTIDPPSRKLLAIHRAICVILHLSGAGEYIDRIMRDMEEVHVRSDGSTELGRIVSLKLGSWLGGVSA